MKQRLREKRYTVNRGSDALTDGVAMGWGRELERKEGGWNKSQGTQKEKSAMNAKYHLNRKNKIKGKTESFRRQKLKEKGFLS